MKKEMPKLATRQASQKTLEVINKSIPFTLGGSADLTGSNLTKTSGMKSITSRNFSGNYVHYGIREHAMGSIMNGVALHKGFIPYGGTFLVFSDYMRASIRLSALMSLRVIYVLTHDSIGLGEDGPTHQPIEHLAILRSTPNLNLIRPADIVETAEAWQIALVSETTPTVLALSRQGLPQLRLGDAIADNKSARGGYILPEASATPQVTLLASGSEVSLADEARTELEAAGTPTRLVSVPCLDVLLAQDEAYKTELLGPSEAVVVVEAGLEMGWAALTGSKAAFVGMTGFGASAPAPALYQHFGITAAAVISAAQQQLA